MNNQKQLTDWADEYEKLKIEQEKLNAKIPMLDLHYNPEANTITIYPAELRVWKQKLLRHLSPTKLVKYKLIAAGICGCLDLAMLEYFITRLNEDQFHNYTYMGINAVKYEFTCSYVTWPYYSGNQQYPVPSQDLEVDPRVYYRSSAYDRWLGKDRNLRIHLLNYWINSIPETGLTLKLINN